MKILFWNVQRLGYTTDDARRTILANLLHAQQPNVVLLCELTTASQIPISQNITYRVPNHWQLCYGAFYHNGNTINLARINPPSTPGYQAIGWNGGNNFANLVNRALAYAGNIGGYEVYVFHAPAYQAGAERAMTFISYSLHAHHGATPWLVIGDFNIEPYLLPAFTRNFVVSGGATYIGGLPREYDYVLTNNSGAITFNVAIPLAAGSDHLPIVIDY